MRYSMLTLIAAVAAVPTAPFGGPESVGAPHPPTWGHGAGLGGAPGAGTGAGAGTTVNDPDCVNGVGIVNDLGQVVCDVVDAVDDLLDNLKKRGGSTPTGPQGPPPAFWRLPPGAGAGTGAGAGAGAGSTVNDPDCVNGVGIVNDIGQVVCDVVDAVDDLVDNLKKREGSTTTGTQGPPPAFWRPPPGAGAGTGAGAGAGAGSTVNDPDCVNGVGIVNDIGQVVCDVVDAVDDLVDNLKKL